MDIDLNLDYLITGTGRCGTVYVSRLLTNIDIICGHESIFTSQGLEEAQARIKKNSFRISGVAFNVYQEDWTKGKEIKAESSYFAAPYINHPILSGAKVVHLVRHPLLVISSFAVDLGYFKNIPLVNKHEEFIIEFVPEIVDVKGTDNDQTKIYRSIVYYLKWNEMIEAACKERESIFVRLEYDIPKLLHFVGRPGAEIITNTKINSCRKTQYPRVTWDDIESVELKKALEEITIRYGYEIEPETRKKILL